MMTGPRRVLLLAKVPGTQPPAMNVADTSSLARSTTKDEGSFKTVHLNRAWICAGDHYTGRARLQDSCHNQNDDLDQGWSRDTHAAIDWFVSDRVVEIKESEFSANAHE